MEQTHFTRNYDLYIHTTGNRIQKELVENYNPMELQASMLQTCMCSNSAHKYGIFYVYCYVTRASLN